MVFLSRSVFTVSLLLLLTSPLCLSGCSSSSSSSSSPEEFTYQDGSVPGSLVFEDEEDDTFEEKVARRKEIIRRQELERVRQEREIRDLKRQKFHNEALREYERPEQNQ